MAEIMCVLGLILSSYPYLRSAMVRFPLETRAIPCNPEPRGNTGQYGAGGSVPCMESACWLGLSGNNGGLGRGKGRRGESRRREMRRGESKKGESRKGDTIIGWSRKLDNIRGEGEKG